jgi:hypothetical protein
MISCCCGICAIAFPIDELYQPQTKPWLDAFHHKTVKEEGRGGGRFLMYKLNVFASARVVCNIMVCKCEVEPTGNCILERSI